MARLGVRAGRPWGLRAETLSGRSLLLQRASARGAGPSSPQRGYPCPFPGAGSPPHLLGQKPLLASQPDLPGPWQFPVGRKSGPSKGQARASLLPWEPGGRGGEPSWVA